MDSNWALVVLTFVLVCITAWYAYCNHKYVRLLEKERKRRVIGEIARGVFSPMLSSLSMSKKYLKDGSFVILRPSKVRVDLYPPSYHLQRAVVIFGDQGGTSGAYCSAEYLLSLPDKILDKHISKIRQLSQEFDEYRNKLEDLLKEIAPLIPSEFKDFCKKLVEEYRKSGRSIEFGREDDYYMLLSYIIGGVKSLPNGHVWREFWEKYRSKLRSWIDQYSTLKEKINHLEKTKEELLELINDLEKEIDSMFMEWKREYGLTEIEMRLYPRYGLI